MKIGVICEGYTDFLTIKLFIENDLKKLGFDISFHIIQPSMDETLPGGWSKVLYWLEKNPPNYRKSVYFKGNKLFSTDNLENKYDALIFQIDSDIIGDKGFDVFLSKRGISKSNPITLSDRAFYIESIINIVSGNSSFLKEIHLAIVESCETWAIAAEENDNDPESMNPEVILIKFDKLLHKYTSLRDHHKCDIIDKNKKLRKELYEKMILEGKTPIGRSIQYDKLIYAIEKINENKILFSNI